MRVCIIVQNSYTIHHRTVPVIFPPNLQTIIKVQMLSIGRDGIKKHEHKQTYMFHVAVFVNWLLFPLNFVLHNQLHQCSFKKQSMLLTDAA